MSITYAGKTECAGLAGNTGSKTAFTYLAYGDDNLTTASPGQTALQGTESQRAAATVSRQTSATGVASAKLRFTKTFSISKTETIGEVGAFNASSGGTMLCRDTINPVRSAKSGDTWTPTYDVNFA